MAVMVEIAPQYSPPTSGEWTVDDLAALPDDGMRYELVDGVLLVTPAPFAPHQAAVVGLAFALRSACPPALQVFVAPIDYQPERHTSLQLDVLVVRRADVRPRSPLTIAPLLAVEVLSRSTRRKDLVFKRSLYEDLGVRSYWMFDPADPSLVVCELVDGRYVEVVKAVATDEITVHHPYPVRLCPTDLAAG
jgi:Uma2 family endonuclease